ncbi:MAG TPA: YihY/virulence factor BrkB family protein [Thermomicrobiaceae bacterium]|nr:YihY/virulence factor BrkB family protein [Thermomicrobiaceae bacterium]
MTAHSTSQSPVTGLKRKAKQVEAHVDRWRITPYIKGLVRRFSQDNTTGLASQVAYNLIFAIPPLLIFLVTLAALVDHFTGLPVAQSFQTAITQHAPSDTQPLLKSLVSYAISQTSGKAASIGAIITVVLAIWGASGGVGTLIQAFNSAYEVKESRSFLPSTLMTLALTILMVVVIIVAFILFIFGQRLGLLIANQLGLGATFTTLWNIARWPAAIIIFLLLLALLYYWGPNIEQSFRWVTPGSVVAAILWFITVLAFKLYITLSNPATGYGAAGSVLVLLVFLYLTGVILILGAQLNAVLETRLDPKTVKARAEHPERRTPAHDSANEQPRQEPASQLNPASPFKSLPTEQAYASGGDRLAQPGRRHRRWLALGLGLGLIVGGLISRVAGALASARRRQTSRS